MKLNIDNCCLLIIDLQEKLLSHIFNEEKIKEKWRLQPGRMLLIDLEKGSIITDEEIKKSLTEKYSYISIVEKNRVKLADLKGPKYVEPILSEKDNIVSGDHLTIKEIRFSTGFWVYARRYKIFNITYDNFRTRSYGVYGHGHAFSCIILKT